MAASAAAAAAVTTTSPSSSTQPKKCFNPDCTDFKSRKGWRLRSGDLADLCDRCASAYDDGRYCETFHLNSSGWRCCESCGKQVHCGCIVSLHSFALLDAGGIECIVCARKNIIFTSNSAWTSSLFSQASFSDRLKEPSIKGWSQLAGSGPVPWRQAPSLFNSSVHQSELTQRVLYEADRLNSNVSSLSLDKGKIEDFSERLTNGSVKLGVHDTGINEVEQPISCLNLSHQSSLREDICASQFGIATPYANETNGQIGGSGPFFRPIPPQVPKNFHGNINNGIDLSVDQNRNARPRADARGRSQLLPRYWPRFTDEELHQISGNSNSVIKPLFEKMLSASDAGRIGRLVLPKKCAEAYFPPISQPEGLPLKVQDSKGKEWIFQFRFWPNNNSRMYVLEGVTPCIQNMQLQAGDIVTFSRLEPEGKLVMGYRKASTAPPSDQENESSKTGNSISANGDAELADPSPWSKVDKSGYIAKEFLERKSSIKKRKSSILGLKSKCLRIENEDMIELKITWEEAQGLLRPPPDHVPSIVVIEGFEFEEYEEAPVLGKPTIFSADNTGQKIQWVQCEDCLKWRKLPVHALLPSKWNCSFNSWDPERSLCSAAQELTAEQLEDLLPASNLASRRTKAVKNDCVEALEGLDTLANLAILGEGESLPASSQVTTKHPRHRPGCSCIVCIQPPSGKGPKHKQTCTCNVCQTVKRRFKTLMMKREKKQTDKESETSKKQPQPLPEKLLDDDPAPPVNAGSSSSPNKNKVVSEGSDDDLNRVKSSASPFKGQIDLNIQPEREDELSPGSDSGSMTRMVQHANERYLKQPKFLSSDCDDYPAGDQAVAESRMGENISNGIKFDSSHQDADEDVASVFPKVSATTPTTG